MKPLVIIPARKGSKRLPGKNTKDFLGKPLISHTIIEAKKIFSEKIICVSTDCKKTKKISEEFGLNVPFIRPKHLSSDTSSSRSVILHAYEYYKINKKYEADTIILLQPTSPLRKSKHIKEAVSLFNLNIDLVVSVKKSIKNSNILQFEENKSNLLIKANNNQEKGNFWQFNGSIYIINIKSLLKYNFNEFKKIKKYEMSMENIS